MFHKLFTKQSKDCRFSLIRALHTPYALHWVSASSAETQPRSLKLGQWVPLHPRLAAQTVQAARDAQQDRTLTVSCRMAIACSLSSSCCWMLAR